MMKHKLGHDAIAIGIRKNSEDTRLMLYGWADWIVLAAGKYAKEIPAEFHPKLKVWDVGTDIWFKGFPEDLLKKYATYLKIDPLQL